MQRLDQLNRRTHLYLGLFLLPWILVYGISSLLLSHPDWVRESAEPTWTHVSETPFQLPIPPTAGGSELRAIAEGILRSVGNEGAFWVERVGTNVVRIHRFSFRDQTRYTCRLTEGKMVTEHQQRRGKGVLLSLHFRGGFEQPTVLDTVWGVMVDVVCTAMVLWVVTGLVMAWRLPATRIWGAFALASGCVSFLYFLTRL